MRGIIYIACVLGLFSCTPKLYNYKLSKNDSTKPNNLHYKNDTLSIAFNFLFEGLMIEVKNRYHDDIIIDWKNMTLLVNDTLRKIEHVTITSFSNEEIEIIQPPSVISPKSGFTDVVVLADNIYYERPAEDLQVMKIRSIYPKEEVSKSTKNYVESLKGQRITLDIPIEVNAVSRQLTFNFILRIKSHRRKWALNALPYVLP